MIFCLRNRLLVAVTWVGVCGVSAHLMHRTDQLIQPIPQPAGPILADGSALSPPASPAVAFSAGSGNGGRTVGAPSLLARAHGPIRGVAQALATRLGTTPLDATHPEATDGRPTPSNAHHRGAVLVSSTDGSIANASMAERVRLPQARGAEADAFRQAQANVIGMFSSRTVTDAVAGAYNVPEGNAIKVWRSVEQATRGTDINPLLMMAVIAQESNFNPNAVSVHGARGVTQVMPIHNDKLRPGERLSSIPVAVRVGVQILQDDMTATGGDVRAALQRYNGSSRDHSQAYARKVMDHERKIENEIIARAGGSMADNRQAVD